MLSVNSIYALNNESLVEEKMLITDTKMTVIKAYAILNYFGRNSQLVEVCALQI